MSIGRLKFRGFKPSISRWIIGGEGECGYDITLETFFRIVATGEIDPATVGQWTGAKDKNGVDIYEGDRVQYKHYVACERWWERTEEIPIIKQEMEEQRASFSIYKSIVRFADGCFKLNYPLTVEDIIRQQRLEYSKGIHGDVESKWWDFEVIGNIHDEAKHGD